MSLCPHTLSTSIPPLTPLPLCSPPSLLILVPQNTYDYYNAEYELCVLRKSKGHKIRLPANKGRLGAEKAMQLLRTHERQSSDGGMR